MKAERGEYEVHLTLRLGDAGDLGDAQAWAGAHGFKFTHIVLDRGASASQPMLTRQWRGTRTEVQAAIALMQEALDDAGFPVTRVKIESAPWNADVPQTATEAKGQPAARYFEHHVKLLLGTEADTVAVARVAEAHDARLSRNARRKRGDGVGGSEERFVTQRCEGGVGRAEAHRRLEALLCALAPLGHRVLEAEEEFVVYDSNLALDAGWFEPAE